MEVSFFGTNVPFLPCHFMYTLWLHEDVVSFSSVLLYSVKWIVLVWTAIWNTRQLCCWNTTLFLASCIFKFSLRISLAWRAPNHLGLEHLLYNGSCVPFYNEHTASRVFRNDGVMSKSWAFDGWLCSCCGKWNRELRGWLHNCPPLITLHMTLTEWKLYERISGGQCASLPPLLEHTVGSCQVCDSCPSSVDSSTAFTQVTLRAVAFLRHSVWKMTTMHAALSD